MYSAYMISGAQQEAYGKYASAFLAYFVLEVGNGNLDISYHSSPEGRFVARARGRRESRVFCDTGEK